MYISNKSKNDPLLNFILIKLETASSYFLILALLEYLELEKTLCKCG